MGPVRSLFKNSPGTSTIVMHQGRIASRRRRGKAWNPAAGGTDTPSRDRYKHRLPACDERVTSYLCRLARVAQPARPAVKVIGGPLYG